MKKVNQQSRIGDPITTAQTAIELFEMQVEKAPNQIAIVFEDRTITYQELNERANQIAHCLIEEQNIQPEDIVALQSMKKEQLIVAIIGVMKAGAAYLPINPELPQSNVAYILEHGNAKALLIDYSIVDQTNIDQHLLPIVILDEVNHNKRQNPTAIAKLQHLANVMYSTGSTGTPKKVTIKHDALVKLSMQVIDYYQVRPEDRISQLASFSFEVSVEEIFPYLLAGASICMRSNQMINSVETFFEYCQQFKLTILNLPSFFWNQLTQTIAGTDQFFPETIRLVSVSGEPMNLPTINKWLKHQGDSPQLINAFSSTETTTNASMFSITSIDQSNNQKQTTLMGKPISNFQFFILDKNHKPTPTGVTGEICIAGPSLTSDYLNDETLANEKFIPHPLDAKERLYKTGDFGYWNKDGNIEFLGRIDQQLKTRNRMIEARAIERQLLQYQPIQNCIVINKTLHDTEVLIAYFVGQNKALIDLSDLRLFLSQHLADHILPSYFVQLDGFPLNLNGKINREALPNPDTNANRVKVKYMAPSNKVEQKLADIWAELLDEENIGIYDNFFELDGNSLKVIQMIALIEKRISAQVQLTEVFSNPTIKELAHLIVLKEVEIAKNIAPAAIKNSYAVSPAQKRLWRLHKIDKQSAVYNRPAMIRMQGVLEVKALKMALDLLGQRHESLRTTFQSINGEVKQIIHPNPNTIFTFSDWVEKDQTENQLDDYIRDYVQAPFDLSSGPLFKVELLQVNQEEHLLLFNIHHIIADGWSVKVLIKELGIVYQACAKNENPDLEPLSIQYKDYTEWQNDRQQDETSIQKIQNYWNQKLSDRLPNLDLPTDFQGTEIKNYQGKTSRNFFGSTRLVQLKKLANDQQATLFMVLVASVKTLLYRYTGQQDLIIGSISAGRNRDGLNNQIGAYSNTLVLRNQIAPDDSFSNFLQQVKQTCLEAIENETVSFDALAQRRSSPNNVHQSELFNVLVDLPNNDQTAFSLGELKASVEAIDSGISEYDLSFSFLTENDQLEVAINYRTDLFKADRIERIFNHLDCLFDSVLDQVNQRIDQINILPEGEEQLISDQFNNTESDFPFNKTVVDLFQDQVEKTPNQIAVVFEEQVLTYQQLNEQSNQVAHYLRNQFHIQPEDIVALQLEHNIASIAAILGVLKAGAAYLPIASNSPQDRVKFLLADSEAKVLIVDRKSEVGIDVDENACPVIVFEDIQHDNKNNPSTSVFSHNLAYLIYTADSSGTPTGVMVEQEALVNLSTHIINHYQIRSKDRILQIASFSVDRSVEEIFPYLLSGASICIRNDQMLHSTKSFFAFCQQYDVTILNLPQIFWNQLTQDIVGANRFFPKAIRIVAVGGASMSLANTQKWLSHQGAYPQLINAYGPTETTVNASMFTISPADFSDQKIQRIPIGQPIANCQVFVLDRNHAIVPIGIPGEICIAGRGLARGYLNNEKLTSEKFIAHPIHAEQRLYKTGDFGYWNADGNIEFIGRSEEQLKVSQHQIESGKIEEKLLEHPQIDQSVVITRKHEGTTILVAYLITKENTSLVSTNIQDFLRLSLPDYLIPSRFVILDQLPQGENEAINRKSFQESNYPIPARSYKPPRNRTEQVLIKIWQTLLSNEQISINDNFLDLGGHSLIAIQMIAMIQQQLSVQITLKDIFSNPSVAALGAVIYSKKANHFQSIPVIEQQKHYALSSAQKRFWAFDQQKKDQHTSNMFRAIRLDGPIDINTLEGSINHLIERHESLRTTFSVIDGEPRQIVHPSSSFKVGFANWSNEHATFEQISNYLNNYVMAPFDLSSGPLFKVELLEIAEQEYILLFNIHQIVADEWSTNILIRDMGVFYDAFTNQQSSPLRPLRIHYKDFAQWRNDSLDKQQLMSKHKNYWQQKLSGDLSTIALPTNSTQPPKVSDQGKTISKIFDQAFVQNIEQLGKEIDATLFMTLTAMVKILLYRYSNQKDLLIGAVSAGRDHVDLKDQIGFYTNTLIIRNQINQQDHFAGFLEQVKQTCLAAFEHELYPYESLVEELATTNDNNHSPLFNVLIDVRNNVETISSLGSTSITPIEADTIISKADLAFIFSSQQEGLKLKIEYRSSLFKADWIKQIFNHFESLYDHIINHPDQTIDQFNQAQNQKQNES